MSHKHVGPVDQACDGCLDEANAEYRKRERRKTIAGLILLIALVISGVVAFSFWLHGHGSKIG